MALFQVVRAIHYLLPEDTVVIDASRGGGAKTQTLGLRERKPKLLFKRRLFLKHDESLISEKAFIHLFFIQVIMS